MPRVAKGMTVAKALVGAVGAKMDKRIKEIIKSNLKGKKLFESINVGQNIKVTKERKVYQGKVEYKTKNLIVISNMLLRTLSLNDFIASDHYITIL